MTAEAGHSDRCRLSCMVQHCCDADIVYDLPSAVFVPAPKVDAAVVQLMPKRVPHKISFDEMDAVTQSIFWARRKTITNNIWFVIKRHTCNDLLQGANGCAFLPAVPHCPILNSKQNMLWQ